MTIDRIEMPVSDPDMARRFGEAALAPFGVECLLSVPRNSRRSGSSSGKRSISVVSPSARR
ncbi:hypothetical protein NOF55_02925 [Rhizobiaceae bacterium BDR2-2]|uniref:Uncharacterized protein n=1 Tax=Ectorhizobium quercum TaxID=2965071 RepID=A0AAE3MVQ1_9HYPH|nr:hypothetical protein [Ectorhizobium quercum]MCX8996048.1 hypothetical protein [Ectorhizobium quercum]